MYESTRQAFDRAKRSMKINPKDRKLTLYSYRHTYGITRALSTGDIYLVAEEMGHADISTTYKNYAKIKPSIIERDFPQYKHVCKLGRFAGLNPKITNTKKRTRIIGVIDDNSSVEPSPQDVKKLSAPYPLIESQQI